MKVSNSERFIFIPFSFREFVSQELLYSGNSKWDLNLGALVYSFKHLASYLSGCN